jgi:hypothetical protein
MVVIVLLAGLLPGNGGAADQASRLEIAEVPAAGIPADVPVIPWVLPADKSWQQAKPLFSVSDAQPEYQATGWMAVTKESILFHIVVKDEKYENTQQGDSIHNGDAIQMGIDALGRSSDTVPTPLDVAAELEKKFGTKTKDEYIVAATKDLADKRATAQAARSPEFRDLDKQLYDAKGVARLKWETEEKRLKKFNTDIDDGMTMLPEDADFCFALGKDNVPRAWSYYHGKVSAFGDKSYLKPAIVRDENAKTTTYDLAIPWKEFGVEAGVSPVLKVSLQFNDDVTPKDKPQHRVYWGKGVGGRFSPWHFKKVALGPPPEPVAVADSSRSEVASAEDYAEVLFAATTDRAYKISADFGGNQKTLDMPAQPGAALLKRYAVRAYPGKLPQGSLALQAALPQADGKVLAERTVSVRDGSMAQWYTWAPTNDSGPSAIGMEDWLDKPAGKHGVLHMKDDAFVFDDGTPVKFWATLRDATSKDKADADTVAATFGKYGINLTRLFGLKSQQPEKKESCTQITDAMWENMDYYHAVLKKQGIYEHLAPVWELSVLPGDKDKVLAYDELAKRTGYSGPGSMGGLVNFAPDLQDLYIGLFVNLLNHRNSITGLTYAEDPAIAIIEFQNEDDIFWAHGGVLACPTYKKLLCEQFSDWLKAKYGTQEDLVKAWGPRALNAYSNFQKDESLEARTIFPITHSWWYTPEGLESQEKQLGVGKRLLDSAQFLHETQDKYYARIEKAIRATGYKGLLIGSNWLAADGVPHYYNLLSDAQVGHVDRHNYWGPITSHYLGTGYYRQAASMLWKPGSCLLSSGMEQVLGHTFGLSECAETPPNEWNAEAPALIGAYGMGLQGWDAVAWCGYGGFTPSLAPHVVYNTGIPTQIGQYPSIARMVLRGDIKQGDIVSNRKVSLTDLKNGKLPFDDKLAAQGDVKEFGGGAPPETLAVGRAVVEFTEKPQAPYLADLGAYIKDRVITSNTGQLVWDYSGAERNEAFCTVNSDGTKAVVGFLPKKEFVLGDVKIAVDNKFAVVFVTSMEKDRTLANCKTAIVTAVARSRNTGMRYNQSGSVLEEAGTAPIVVEPVFATIQMPRAKSVTPLDHDGRRTSKTVAVENGRFSVNGVTDKTLYYGVSCE